MTVWGWTPPPESAHTNRTPWYTPTRKPALRLACAQPAGCQPRTHTRGHKFTCAPVPAHQHPDVHGRLPTPNSSRTHSPVWTNAHLHVHAATTRTHHAHKTLGLKTQIAVTDTRVLQRVLGLRSQGPVARSRCRGRIREAKLFPSR